MQFTFDDRVTIVDNNIHYVYPAANFYNDHTQTYITSILVKVPDDSFFGKNTHIVINQGRELLFNIIGILHHFH
jgi:hypothetical protein